MSWLTPSVSGRLLGQCGKSSTVHGNVVIGHSWAISVEGAAAVSRMWMLIVMSIWPSGFGLPGSQHGGNVGEASGCRLGRSAERQEAEFRSARSEFGGTSK